MKSHILFIIIYNCLNYELQFNYVFFQVWHYCDLNGGQASFLCPNGTIFNQVTLTCDWWFNVKCDTTAQLYVLNERLYKYIIPSKPSFPEDYEGPLVDRYLEDKFKETEKNRGQQRAPMPLVMNVTTIEPESVRTPYQQLIDVDVQISIETSWDYIYDLGGDFLCKMNNRQV